MIINYNGLEIVQASSIFTHYNCFGKREWVFNFRLNNVHPGEDTTSFYLHGFSLASLIYLIELHRKLEELSNLTLRSR